MAAYFGQDPKPRRPLQARASFYMYTDDDDVFYLFLQKQKIALSHIPFGYSPLTYNANPSGRGMHPSYGTEGYASKAKSSVLSELSGLENVLFNDFIDDELDSEDVSEQRASASLPDSVPIESEEERAAREEDEMAALDAVGDYEADPTVMLEDVPQDIVFKTLKVSCACVAVLVFACVCVCVCVRARASICVRENLYLHFLNFVCVCACNREGTSHTSSRVDGRLE
jgi:hypothetical protein